MVIQHNLSAMNGDRMNGIVDRKKAKSTEKLSSGYRINRAADDAAGLAMSEKMRRQIRGLSQASDNSQDGISMVQTAEGALNEVHDMLQRMNELCVKAANGTMNYEDRSYIQSEITAITDEIDRVGVSTTFNEIKLFNGLPQTKTNAVAPGATVNGAKGTVTQADEENDARYTINNLQIGDVVLIPAHGDVADAYYQLGTPGQDTGDHDGSSADKAKIADESTILHEIAKDLGRTNLGANSDLTDSVSVTYSRGPTNTNFDIHFFCPG